MIFIKIFFSMIIFLLLVAVFVFAINKASGLVEQKLGFVAAAVFHGATLLSFFVAISCFLLGAP